MVHRLAATDSRTTRRPSTPTTAHPRAARPGPAGLVRFTFGHARSLDPSQPGPYLVAELDFDSEQAMGESMASAGGARGGQGHRATSPPAGPRSCTSTCSRRADGERRAGTDPDAGRRGRRRLLRQPRHVGDALRRRAGRRPRDARGAHAVRGRGHRRGRRLRADGRPPGRDAAAPRARAWATGWPTCTTPAAARAPLVNVVGDHARSHKRLDAPLESDIDAVAGTVSGWVRRSLSPADVAADAVEAVAAASSGARVDLDADPPGRRLVGGRRRGRPRPLPVRPAPARGAVAWSRTSPRCSASASRPCCSSAATSMDADGPARRGAGRGRHRRAADDGDLPGADDARRRAARRRAAAAIRRRWRSPRWPGRSTWCWPARRRRCTSSATRTCPGTPVPEDCTVHVLSAPGEDGVAALRALAAGRRAGRRPRTCWRRRGRSCRPGELTPRAMAAVVGALLPEDAILVDEALTSGVGLAELTSGAPRHDWLCLTGGAIGDGLPMALGAAIACPEPAGDRHPGRRQRDVHDLGAVVLRPRAGRHHDDRLRQRLVRDPRSTSCRGSGRPATASGPGSCSTSADRRWTSSRWPRAWACRRPGRRRRRSWPTSSGARWPSPGRT